MNRRLLLWLAATMLLLVAAGCGKHADESGKKETSSQGGSTSQIGGGSTSGSGSSPGSVAGSGSNPGSQTGGSTAPGSSGPTTPGGSGGGEKAPAPTYEKVTLGPLSVGESAKVGPITITLSQVNQVDQAPAPGYTYLLVELSVQNDGVDKYTLNITDHFKAETPEGKKASYNLQASAHRSPKLQGTLETGESTIGWLGHLAKLVDGTYKYTYFHPDYGEATWEFGL